MHSGPVQILTGHAQKALYILKNNPELYSCTIETEMKNVMQLRQEIREPECYSMEVFLSPSLLLPLDGTIRANRFGVPELNPLFANRGARSNVIKIEIFWGNRFARIAPIRVANRRAI